MFWLATLLLPAAALAQDAPEQPAAELAAKPRWTIEVEPAVYYVAPGGDLRLPSSAGRGDKVKIDSLNLDSPRVSPYLEFTVKPSRWGVTASGFWFETNNDESTQSESGQIGSIAFAPGDRLESQMTFWSAEAQVLYRLVDDHVLRDASGEESMLVSLDVRLGARVYDVDTSVTALSGVSSGANSAADKFFAEPVIGMKGEIDIYRCFTLDLTTTFGVGPWGDSSSYSWDIIVGGAWRPIENVGVLIGYRQLLFSLEDGNGADEFEFTGAMAGVYGGIELRF